MHEFEILKQKSVDHIPIEGASQVFPRPASNVLLHKKRTYWQFGSTKKIREHLFESNVELNSVESNCYTKQVTKDLLLVSGFSWF